MYWVSGGEEWTDILSHPHRGLHPRAVASHLSKIVQYYVSFMIYDSLSIFIQGLIPPTCPKLGVITCSKSIQPKSILDCMFVKACVFLVGSIWYIALCAQGWTFSSMAASNLSHGNMISVDKCQIGVQCESIVT